MYYKITVVIVVFLVVIFIMVAIKNLFIL